MGAGPDEAGRTELLPAFLFFFKSPHYFGTKRCPPPLTRFFSIDFKYLQ
jgi:hypothetical protein